MNRWTIQEIKILEDSYPKIGIKKSAELLNRTYNSVRRKVELLKKSSVRNIAWTDDEVNFLKNNYSKGSKYCAEVLLRDVNCIQNKALKLGITKESNPNWNLEELEFLETNYYELGPTECAKYLNRNMDAIKTKASSLGLKANNSGKRFSNKAIKWLKSFNNPNIIHALNGGEYYIAGYHVDGYDPESNIVYEFHGDIFHGNLELFDENDKIHPFNDKTAGQLFQQTFNKMNDLSKVARVIYIWENDFDRGLDHEQF